ncbi:signal peptidase I [Bdellovibrio sp. ZAP7]|uniref:signal peptidase I n=1 Tax=Bdellovibrio sp. ZAP7 TaxID=2231053 RepID=UPI00143D38B8|nr:signal peptidase I [Bdellovibrio sp. ZAP7]
MKVIEIIKKNRSFLLSILLLFAVRWSFADQYRVPSESMFPQLHIGDHIAVNKMAYDLKLPFTSQSLKKISDPQRGDVIVFIWPGDNSSTFVKRLIGLPGDRIHIENGFVTINGAKLADFALEGSAKELLYDEHLESHTYHVQRVPRIAREQRLDLVVPDGEYFFMGDNRDNSLDSRYWGFVKREALKGKVDFVLWNIRFDNILPELELNRIGSKVL